MDASEAEKKESQEESVSLLQITIGVADEQIAAPVRAELESLHVVSPNRCIYRVPEYLRQLNKEAYRPMVVSIGPFYYQDERLKAMQEQKLRHLEVFLKHNSYSLEHYISYLREREEEAREYYDEELTSLSSDEFTKMLLLDSAFIIELFLWFKGARDINDQKMIAVIDQVMGDLFVEENQIPFFIMNGLYDLAFGLNSEINFIGRSFEFIHRNITRTTACNESDLNVSTIRHLLDLQRICLLPSILRKDLPKSNKVPDQYPKSASELRAAGIQFVVGDGKSLLDISFDGEVLKIPKFHVDSGSEAAYRNILWYEQCRFCRDTYFHDYIVFLEELIDTPQDVQLLVKSGIMRNSLGSEEEAADLFNKVTKNTFTMSRDYYSDLCADLNEYTDKKWNKWRAILKRNYFTNPWSIVSVIAAIVLLFLTILQTIASFVSMN